MILFLTIMAFFMSLVALIIALIAYRRQFNIQDVFDEWQRRYIRYMVLEEGEDMSEIISDLGEDPVVIYGRFGLVPPTPRGERDTLEMNS